MTASTAEILKESAENDFSAPDRKLIEEVSGIATRTSQYLDGVK